MLFVGPCCRHKPPWSFPRFFLLQFLPQCPGVMPGVGLMLNLYNYDLAIDFDIKYPDLDLAINFSYETTLTGRNLRKESKFSYDFS